MFAALPLMALPILCYNLFSIALPGGIWSGGASTGLTKSLFTMPTAGGGVWPVSLSDLLLAMGLIVLFIELIRATARGRWMVVNHGLSIVIFVACLAELLFVPACASSTFFLLTLMVLLDVLAGLVGTFSRRRAVAAAVKGAKFNQDPTQGGLRSVSED